VPILLPGSFSGRFSSSRRASAARERPSQQAGYGTSCIVEIFLSVLGRVGPVGRVEHRLQALELLRDKPAQVQKAA